MSIASWTHGVRTSVSSVSTFQQNHARETNELCLFLMGASSQIMSCTASVCMHLLSALFVCSSFFVAKVLIKFALWYIKRLSKKTPRKPCYRMMSSKAIVPNSQCNAQDVIKQKKTSLSQNLSCRAFRASLVWDRLPYRCIRMTLASSWSVSRLSEV